MSSRIHFVAVAIAALLLGCSQPQDPPYRAGDGRTGEYGEMGVSALQQIVWKHRAKASIAAPVAQFRDLVIAVDTDGAVVALDSTDGSVRWEARLEGHAHGVPIAAGNRVLVGGDHGLVALGYDGKVQWKAEGSAIEAAPLIVDQVAYVGSREGNVLAIDIVGGSLIWEAVTAGPVTAAAVRLDDGIVVGSGDGRVYMLAPATGEPRWSWATRAAIRGLAASGDRLFITAGREIITLDADEPKTSKWRKDLGAIVETPPSLSGGVVIAGTAGGEVVGLDTTDGSPLFRREVGSPVVGDIAVTREQLVVPAARSGLVVIDRAGNEVWKFRTDGRVTGFAPAPNRLYVTDAAGSVYALE